MALKDPNSEIQWNEFCKRLAKLTTNGTIQWEDWSEHISRPNPKSGLFVTSYKDWIILVYRHDYKYYTDEDVFEWQEDVVIEIIDEKGNVKWTLPRVPSRISLLDLVQFKNARVESLFDDVMGNDSEG